MRLTDQFGYEVTVASEACLEAWNATVLAFLAHSKHTPVKLDAALQADPDFALAQSVRGLFCLLLGRREMFAAARDCLTTARRAALERDATPREQAVIEALSAWLDGWPARAADLLDAALVSAPRDALLVKLVHAIRFVLGDARGMRTSIETVLPAHDPTLPTYGYMLGCKAFCLEENGEYRAAEALGRQGLEYAPDDAWGLHAVAHVHDMTGRSEEGIAWLERHPDGWAHCNNFGYHVWWHLALMYLDQGDIQRVMALYDSEIRLDKTDDYRDISNAASLLARLELEGVNVGARWEELALLSDKRAEDGCNVFADLHYLLALVNGGRRMGTERLLASMQRQTEAGGDLAPVFEKAGLPAGLGLEQFRLGNYGSAFMYLRKARADLPRIGGSHAQRDVFERLTIDAGMRAGLFEDAKALLQERARKRGAVDRYAEQRLEVCERMRRASRVMEDERLRASAS
ncbi:tetratricopeptide repeat protein 38 family protein [Roseibium aquae]|uniref:Tetratricopeptide repeat protein 38 n=1 Tax=Roseibium aquae TaxID=1323746 RepID=A0A916TIS5_9HYPH|nr:tetratricopeptide repeat protein [Roseibium aquae]GGB47084.1 tetratricopeptide repeat protein 38 family protein [Roseibium aquae]